MLTILLIIMPLLFSLAAFAIQRGKWGRLIALCGSTVVAGLAIASLFQYKYTCHCNLEFSAVGWASLGIGLNFGMDGVNIWLVMLTAFLIPLIVLSTFGRSYPRPNIFYGLILLTEMALMGLFTIRDGLVFFIFWEFALATALVITARWGGEDRKRTVFKFFACTSAGSLLMLAGLIYIYLKTPVPHSFDFMDLYEAALTRAERFWIFAAFFLAVAVTIPIFPFHFWQPGALTSAPAAGSMLLGGIMLKMGLYGLIRLLVPFAGPDLAAWGDPVMILAITGIFYAYLMAVTRDDLKRLVAYCSIANAGLVAAGLLFPSEMVLKGGIIQMVAQGINITGLFILTDFIEQRTGTRSIKALSGIAAKAPKLAVLFMILLLGTIAMPLTNGLPGTFILLTELFRYNKVYAIVSGLTVIFSAVFLIWVYLRAFLGKANDITCQMNDLTLTEMISVVPLAAMVMVIGCYPDLILCFYD